MCFVDDMVSNFEIGIGLQGCLFECFFIFCDPVKLSFILFFEMAHFKVASTGLVFSFMS